MSEFLKNKKVMIIDDEAGLRDMLVFGLQNDGCEVLAAANGNEALEKAQQAPIDLAVCDIMMPGMNGLEVLKALKELQPEMEIIMATGFATLQTAVEALKAGAFDYIAKPYDLAQIRLVLEKAVQTSDLRNKVLEMQEMVRIKSEFLVSKSREMREPCQEILSDSTELLGSSYGTLAQPQAQIVGRIEANAQILIRIMKSFADFSKSKL